jgi:putative hydrolase of HD superfamily
MILDFFKTAVNLKNISRQGWMDKLSLKHPESVADHSYSMAIMGMIISDLENYDFEKILKMILLHDLAESKIGDFTPNQISKENKIKIENNAYDEIISALPEAIKLQYGQIWEEYQKHESPESKIVHQIDKLEMALQAKMYQKQGSSKDTVESFFKSAENEIIHPKLKDILNQILQD